MALKSFLGLIFFFGIFSIMIIGPVYGQSENFPDISKFDLNTSSSPENLEESIKFFNFNNNYPTSDEEFDDNLKVLPFSTAVISSSSNTTDSLVFEGIVSDSKSAPVSDLNVNLFGAINYANDITDSQGHYALYIDPGNYSLFIQSSSSQNLPNLPDFFRVYSSENFPITTDTIQDLTFPNVSLDVTVLDFDGQPVNDVSITATASEDESNAFAQTIDFNFYLREKGQTNSAGQTTLDLFQSSMIEFVIRPPKDSELKPFAVSMPVSKDSKITFQFPAPVQFEGTIRFADGTRVPNFLISLYSYLNSFYDITNSQGHYSMEVIPGSYHMYSFDYSNLDYPNLPQRFILSLLDPVDISSDTVLDLTLPNVSLKATVLDFNGNPVSGSSLTATGYDNFSKNKTPSNKFDYKFADSSLTDKSGKATLDLFSSSGINLAITPPAGSDLRPLYLSELSITENEERTFILDSIFNEKNPTTDIRIPTGTSIPGCETNFTCFLPYDLQVYRESTVVWSNDDSAAHTVTAGSASDGPSGEFDSSLFMSGTTYSHTFDDPGKFEYFCMVHPWMNGIVTVVEKTLKSSSGGNEWDTRPTFGESHETNNELIVENGFTFNSNQYSLTDNHHTDFAQESIVLGTTNSFSAKVYADKKLKVQEFLFGIPNVGESHLAELGIEVWYDTNGNVDDVKVIQKSNVIDTSSLVVSHAKSNCISSDQVPRCDTTTVSMTFLEPLQDNVMAIKAIDFKNRDQRTYLNDGFDISGESLNPMQSNMIPSTVRDEGLIKVTQVAKYSPFWITDDERMFEMNSFGSFKQINQEFERFQDSGEAKNRLHSGFAGKIKNEQTKATEIFDASKLISELPDSFGHHIEIKERITQEMMQEMILQEQSAQEIVDKMDRQTREY
ncbi:MAG: plastocyanin/azurin family copper-binding protein [Nitrosopumilus sp.]|nr:plastocyanin/azurin family copper-binding protein [Nitrosopumilus sp.]